MQYLDPLLHHQITENNIGMLTESSPYLHKHTGEYDIVRSSIVLHDALFLYIHEPSRWFPFENVIVEA